MKEFSGKGFGTRAIHAGQEPDPTTGAIMTPIYQTSTYVQEAPAQHKGYAYARGKIQHARHWRVVLHHWRTQHIACVLAVEWELQILLSNCSIRVMR